MSLKTMSLKGKIKNYAKNSNIAAQVVLQNFMFERFLARLSQSEYRQKFVIKGGMLIAAIVGLDTRSTMDLDTTLRNQPLSEAGVLKAVKEICEINLEDGMTFDIRSITFIRKDDSYGGFRVRFDAVYDTIVTPLSIDISTGDVITPAPVQYEFSGIFDENIRIKLWGYNIETVMAEKVETILSRGIFNTRPRDFYDVYILKTTQNYDREIFRDAMTATSKHRGSSDKIADTQEIIGQIMGSDDLKQIWIKYQRRFAYAADVTYEDTINALKSLVEFI